MSESEFIECTTPRLDNYDVSTQEPTFINWNKCSPLLGVLITGDAVAVDGERGYTSNLGPFLSILL